MIAKASLRPHFESAQRGVLNRNFDSWLQLTDILDSAGRLGIHEHALFVAKIFFQCRSVILSASDVEWDDVRWGAESALTITKLSELMDQIETGNLDNICRILNRLVSEAYRIRIIASSMPKIRPIQDSNS